MRIELLYFDGCPSYQELLPELRRLLVDEGVVEEIELLQIESIEGAERERFLGSPTVRIDGEDVDPGAAGRADFGLKCRLYRNEGRVTKTPPEPWIRAALERPADLVLLSASTGAGLGILYYGIREARAAFRWAPKASRLISTAPAVAPGQCSSRSTGPPPRRTKRRTRATTIASSSWPASGMKSGIRLIGRAR